ncbi:MAG: hypothetical protein K2J39_09240 [Ruminococcus sp.]|nr:hypothetical protein [Ruminococcus sp.]
MRKKILKICIIIFAVWLFMGIIDYTLVTVMKKKPFFCTADEDCHYSGIGYEFDIYTSPYTGNPEYAFYIFGRLTDCNFTNGG